MPVRRTAPSSILWAGTGSKAPLSSGTPDIKERAEVPLARPTGVRLANVPRSAFSRFCLCARPVPSAQPTRWDRSLRILVSARRLHGFSLCGVAPGAVSAPQTRRHHAWPRELVLFLAPSTPTQLAPWPGPTRPHNAADRGWRGRERDPGILESWPATNCLAVQGTGHACRTCCNTSQGAQLNGPSSATVPR